MQKRDKADYNVWFINVINMQEVKATIGWRMDKQNVIYPHNEIQHSDKKE